uniref:Ig-like domain-containing protein n=1 Tax=Oryzias latipes TaxID=8090 RepID=A0A3P9J944_ORYLA
MERRVRALALLAALLCVGQSQARIVKVPPGPLVRVEGEPVSIRCDVTQYDGPREQEFDWIMSKEDKLRINIISTMESDFTDAALRSRVASGDITIQRLQDNVVELRVKAVTAQDSGTYWCRTPSTDSVTSGNYEAQVILTVIPKSLKVSPQAPPPVVPEGSDLVLACNVTRDLTHSTFLSVSWSVKKAASPEELLTFGPGEGVTVGVGVAQRFLDGGVRFLPGRNGVFQLVISRAMASDSGVYGCTGTEWTSENRKWVQIVQSVTEMGRVTVTPTDQSLTVKTSSSPSSSSSSSLLLYPGDTLTLTCSVAADTLDALALEVGWLADGKELIRMERGGVVSSNSSKGAGLSLERTGAGEYRLKLREVSGADGGRYACRTRAFVKQGGAWLQTADKTSDAVTVKVSEIKPNLTLTLKAALAPTTTDDPAELVCNVSAIAHLPAQSRLAVKWEQAPGDANNPAATHTVASLDAHGNLIPGPVYAERLKGGAVALSRVQPNAFKLRFLQMQDVDSGEYVCTVSSWSVNSQGDATQTSEYKSPPLPVRWVRKNPVVNVAAKTVREASVGGATFEMSCKAFPENLDDPGFSVEIQWQDGLGGDNKTIMTLNPDNVMQHGPGTEPNRRDALVLTKSGAAEFRFRLAGVQLSDKGYYWCKVTAFKKQKPGQTWTKVVSSESNKVRIDFQENGLSFSINLHSNSSSVFPMETATMECSLTLSGSSPQTGSVAYEVRWYFSRLRGGGAPVLVGSMSRFGVVSKALRNSSSDVSVERKDADTFLLSIHGTQSSDSGEYQCFVTPWYVSAATGAWTEAGELTSSRLFLTVRFAVWDSLKLPLLYGAAASLVVGLLSVLLGLLFARCCRNGGRSGGRNGGRNGGVPILFPDKD